jgi:3-hydroxybutyryl-CoA dehydratase
MNQVNNIQKFSFEEIDAGMTHVFSILIDRDTVDSFANLSGDYSPIHMNEFFAKGRKLNNRVVHGLLLGSFVSRAVGMFLPGENALIQSVQLTFHAPAYIDRIVNFSSVVSGKYESVKTISLKCTATDKESSKQLMTAKVMVGFTSEVGHV